MLCEVIGVSIPTWTCNCPRHRIVLVQNLGTSPEITPAHPLLRPCTSSGAPGRSECRGFCLLLEPFRIRTTDRENRNRESHGNIQLPCHVHIDSRFDWNPRHPAADYNHVDNSKSHLTKRSIKIVTFQAPHDPRSYQGRAVYDFDSQNSRKLPRPLRQQLLQLLSLPPHNPVIHRADRFPLD